MYSFLTAVRFGREFGGFCPTCEMSSTLKKKNKITNKIYQNPIRPREPWEFSPHRHFCLTFSSSRMKTTAGGTPYALTCACDHVSDLSESVALFSTMDDLCPLMHARARAIRRADWIVEIVPPRQLTPGHPSVKTIPRPYRE